MKRSWIGLGLLLALLLASGLVTRLMDRMHQPIADHLEQAAALALEGHWEQADAPVPAGSGRLGPAGPFPGLFCRPWPYGRN